VQPPEVIKEVAGLVAEAGISVVTLPQTNLFLQARDRPSAPPRGLTAVRALMDAGATVAGGADNLRDPFNTMGRSDPLETAALLVMAAHLSPGEAYAAVSEKARAAMGLPAVRLAPGHPAELLAVRGETLTDAIAEGAADRHVFARGLPVASTRTVRELRLPPPAESAHP
jgi:cytosine deaminase